MWRSVPALRRDRRRPQRPTRVPTHQTRPDAVDAKRIAHPAAVATGSVLAPLVSHRARPSRQRLVVSSLLWWWWSFGRSTCFAFPRRCFFFNLGVAAVVIARQRLWRKPSDRPLFLPPAKGSKVFSFFWSTLRSRFIATLFFRHCQGEHRSVFIALCTSLVYILSSCLVSCPQREISVDTFF